MCGAIHTERKEKVIAGLCRRQSREKRRWSEYLYILKRKEKKSRGRNDLPAYCFAFSSRKAYLDDGQLGNGKRRGSGGASQLLDASKRQRQPLAGQRWSRAHLPVRTRGVGQLVLLYSSPPNNDRCYIYIYKNRQSAIHQVSSVVIVPKP